MDELFEIDDGALGQHVFIGLRQGLLINGQQASYIITSGVLKEIAPRSILLETTTASILGPPGLVTVPKNALAFVNRPSTIIRTSLMPPNT